MSQISGSRALITGGARGIGRLVAERLAKGGARVALVDRDVAGLAEAKKAIGRFGSVDTFEVDLTDSDATYRVASDVEACLGGVDIVVNNAGYVKGGALTQVSEEDHTRTFEVNVLGVTRMTRAVLPGMIARRRGHVVNIASAAGLTGVALQTTYSASKWAVVGFSEALAYELETLGHPIQVSCICPSFVDTGMFRGVTPPKLIPMLQPDDVARAIEQAIVRNERLVTLPLMVGAIPILRGLVPAALRGRIASVLGVNSAMKGWQGH